MSGSADLRKSATVVPAVSSVSAVGMATPIVTKTTNSIHAHIKTTRFSSSIYDETEKTPRRKRKPLPNMADRTPGPQRFTRFVKLDQTISTPSYNLRSLGRSYNEAMDEDSGYDSPVLSFPGRPCAVGREKMDLLGELYKHEPKILDRVLSELDVKDVLRFSSVCLSWRQIVQANSVASKRKRSYLLSCRRNFEINKENSPKKCPQQTTVSTTTPLREVQSLGRPQASSTPSEVVEHRNYNRFIKASESLLADESLTKCAKPACRSPARLLMNDQRAKCTHCGYDFCTNCLLAFHVSSACTVLEPKNSSRQPVGIGSAKSKRSLRRISRLGTCR